MIYKEFKEDFVPSLHDTIYTKEQWIVVIREGKVCDTKSFMVGDYVFVFTINSDKKAITNQGYLGKILKNNKIEYIETYSSDYRRIVNVVVRYIQLKVDRELEPYTFVDANSRDFLIRNIFRLKKSIDNSSNLSIGFVDETKTDWVISKILSTKTITMLDDEFTVLPGVISNIKYPFYMVHRLDNYVTVSKVYSDKILKIYDPLSSRKLNLDDIKILKSIENSGVKLFFYGNDIETLMIRQWSKFPWTLELILESTNDSAYKKVLRDIFDLTDRYKYNKSSDYCILSILNKLPNEDKLKYKNLLLVDLKKFMGIPNRTRKLVTGDYTITLEESNLQIMGNGVNTGHHISTLQDMYDYLYACVGSQYSDYLSLYEMELEELFYGWIPSKSAFNKSNLSEFNILMEDK